MSARRGLALLTAVVLAVLVIGAGTQGTFAYFTDRASVSAGGPGASATAFTSGGLATPATPTRTQTGSAVVAVSWTATAVGTLGGTASAYDVLRYSSATGGTPTTVCSTTGALTCNDTAAPATTAWYSVQARIGASWVKESARVQYVPDVTAPTVVIATPLNGCAAVACGTAADAGGVGSVSYSFRRTLTGVITATQSFDCWNGSAWVDTTAGAACPFLTASGTTSWTVPGAKATAYASTFLYNRSYTLTVRATDNLGNQSAPVSATYTP